MTAVDWVPIVGQPGEYEYENDEIRATFAISQFERLPPVKVRADGYWRMRVRINEKNRNTLHVYSNFQRFEDTEENLGWATSVIQRHLAHMAEDQED